MTFLGKVAVCLAGGLALSASLRADDLAVADNPLPDNPYSSIVQRNVFGLNPPSPPVPAEEQNPPPKITANGLQNFFGKPEVLFKVSGANKPGQPAKDQFYTMKQGERQDDIEVVKIDEKNGMITFKNHGEIQEIALAVAPSPSGGSPSPLPGPRGAMTPPPAPTGADNGNQRSFGRFGQRGGGFGRSLNGVNGGNPTPAPPGGDNMNLNLRSIPTRTYQPEASTVPADQVPYIIEQQRAAALDSGDPRAALLPPTRLTGTY